MLPRLCVRFVCLCVRFALCTHFVTHRPILRRRNNSRLRRRFYSFLLYCLLFLLPLSVVAAAAVGAGAAAVAAGAFVAHLIYSVTIAPQAAIAYFTNTHSYTLTHTDTLTRLGITQMQRP